MKALGKKYWLMAGGNIPSQSTGEEPAFTSHEKIAILNTAKDKIAKVEITIFYEDTEPVRKYECEVEPQRLKKLRFNELIDPSAMPLETNYGFYLESDIPVVVQFSGMDTSRADNARISTLAYPVKDD